jgi:hypothetical protein
MYVNVVDVIFIKIIGPTLHNLTSEKSRCTTFWDRGSTVQIYVFAYNQDEMHES